MKAALIVAHPDDETLWAGGTVLSHSQWNWFVLCLCRGSDTDRAPRFYEALRILRSGGIMGDLDDGPDQKPMEDEHVEQLILHLLPHTQWDLILTHSPEGEYTRHLRHEETGKAVISLWQAGTLTATRLWNFAYEDGRGQYRPRPDRNATKHIELTQQTWLTKYRIITETYGFKKNSFEAETTPHTESFREFGSPGETTPGYKMKNTK